MSKVISICYSIFKKIEENTHSIAVTILIYLCFVSTISL